MGPVGRHKTLDLVRPNSRKQSNVGLQIRWVGIFLSGDAKKCGTKADKFEKDKKIFQNKGKKKQPAHAVRVKIHPFLGSFLN